MTRYAGGLLLLFAISLAANAFPMTVLYTNDLHVRLDRLDALAAAITQERIAGDPVLLFDAGDTWHDYRMPTTTVWGSDIMIAWMNAMSYSAMALGNHDTYWGPQRLSALVNRAEFPVLSANWRPDGPGLPLQASVILEVEGVRILVIGLTTSEFLPFSAYPNLRFLDPGEAVQEQLVRHAGAYDLVFVVGHVPISDSREIAKQVPEVDLFITGHSHERTEVPVVEGQTLIVQSGAFGEALGRLRVEVEAGHLTVLSNDLIPIEKTPADLRAGVRKLVATLTVIVLATALWWF
jgi:2',3'-cyclic-nucleotide 2'-phosphodiesterase (5'-nucleotidase family)